MDLREHVCYPSLDGDLSNEHLNRQKKRGECTIWLKSVDKSAMQVILNGYFKWWSDTCALWYPDQPNHVPRKLYLVSEFLMIQNWSCISSHSIFLYMIHVWWLTQFSCWFMFYKCHQISRSRAFPKFPHHESTGQAFCALLGSSEGGIGAWMIMKIMV